MFIYFSKCLADCTRYMTTQKLRKSLTYSDGAKGGRLPFDPVMTLKIRVI